MNNKGFTFLEILISLSILTIALLGFFQIFNTALNSSYRATQEMIATNLARGLMAEIMSKNFADSLDPTPAALGPDGTESRHGGVGNAFDDVDDYNNCTDGPPPYTIGGLPMNGTAGMPNYSGFTRSVTVQYCEADDATDSIIPRGSGYQDHYHKLITVTVSGPYVSRGITIDEVKAKEE